jgi:hypothetical protein
MLFSIKVEYAMYTTSFCVFISACLNKVRGGTVDWDAAL